MRAQAALFLTAALGVLHCKLQNRRKARPGFASRIHIQIHSQFANPGPAAPGEEAKLLISGGSPTGAGDAKLSRDRTRPVARIMRKP
jgi:hypothetical protein